jgi:hypothetical protein
MTDPNPFAALEEAARRQDAEARLAGRARRPQTPHPGPVCCPVRDPGSARGTTTELLAEEQGSEPGTFCGRQPEQGSGKRVGSETGRGPLGDNCTAFRTKWRLMLF